MNTAPLPLDHVVILVADLEQAIADYSALGFTVQRGGTHADGFTHNALVGFADGSYLELIAFLGTRPQHRWWRWAERGHTGFIDYALLPPTVGEVVTRARAAGVDYQGPIDGGRTRLDGQVLRWQIGMPPTPELPFLCGDVTPRPLRVREGDVRQHGNGVSGIASITVLVDDLATAVQRHRALLGGEPLLPATLVAGAGLAQAVFRLGPSLLALVAPGPDAAHPLAAAWVAKLSSQGSGVIGLTLHGPASAALPRAQTHGAAMDIQGPSPMRH
ncbi:MAG: VOC family protein [Aquabacterium sp.]